MSVASLCIYNPSLAQSESSELDQVIYFGDYIGDVSEGAKLRHVGLIQGIIAFAQSFSENDDLDAVNSGHAMIVPVRVEADWWIVVKMRLESDGGDLAAAATISKYQISEEIRRAYRAFCMDNGAFSALFRGNERAKVCDIVETWWTEHFHILKRKLSKIDAIAAWDCKTSDKCIKICLHLSNSARYQNCQPYTASTI